MQVIGTGSQQVYVYYFQTYRLQALRAGQTVWPCKIGETTRDASGRVHEQVKTAYPERPVIALVIKCQSARRLESALHAILKLYYREVKYSPGKEWYFTTPEEVMGLCKMLRQC